MPSTVISVRVDTATLHRAMRVIEGKETTLADVVKTTISNIAETEEVPVDIRLTAEEQARREEGHRRFQAFMEFCDSVEWAPWLSTLTTEQMRDMIASEYV